MITDELREYANKAIHREDYMAGMTFDLNRIADRIDEKHECGMQQAHADGLNEQIDYHDNFLPRNYMLRPVDADGVPILIGDKVTEHEDGLTFKVDGYMDWDGEWWVFMRDGVQAPASKCTHYHKPTVEELLEEMYDALDDARIPNGSEKRTYEEIIAEYAQKLQLREA